MDGANSPCTPALVAHRKRTLSVGRVHSEATKYAWRRRRRRRRRRSRSPTNQACGEVLIKHVNEILASQGKAIDQALQVTRHIVENYEEQGRLSHLHAHLNDRAWIGKWVIYSYILAMTIRP